MEIIFIGIILLCFIVINLMKDIFDLKDDINELKRKYLDVKLDLAKYDVNIVNDILNEED